MESDLEFTLTKAIDVSGVRTFESNLGSSRMSFKRTTYADESLSQVRFRRVYRARGLTWSAGVV